MKTYHRIFLLACCLQSALLAHGYDLWVDGICYNIVSFDERLVEVTCDDTRNGGTNTYSNWVDVPREIEHNGRVFRVVGVGRRAFYGCRDLYDVTLAEGVQYIGYESFANLKDITTLTLPATLDSIAPSAFRDSKALKSITLHGNVSLGDYAFANCSALQSVAFKGNVTSIGENAFDHCGALTMLSLPAGLAHIGENAFLGCYALTAFKVSNNNPYFCSTKEGLIFDKEMTTLVACPNGYEGAYSVPASVATLANAAFAGCKKLSELTLPAGLKDIGFAAFDRCQSLKHITNLAAVPQHVSEGTFATYGTLHVLPGCQSAYKAASQWANFRIVADAVDPLAGELTVPDSDEVRCRVSNGCLIVEGARQGTLISVHSLCGEMLCRTRAYERTLFLSVPNQSVYLVRVGKRTMKIHE